MTINALVSSPARSADMAPPATAKPLPPLENGDHLSASEFERRYEAMPQLPTVLAMVQEGLQSPEHGSLVEQLGFAA
jgi:hypothetical protein